MLRLRSTTPGTIAQVALVATLAFAGGVAARQPPTAVAPIPDIQKLGPPIGDPIPDFTLSDQRGEPHTLQSLMGANGLMLVFYRSADW